MRRKKAAAQKTRGNGARNSRNSVKKLELMKRNKLPANQSFTN